MANDNERWIIDAGDTVVQRRIAHGMARLKPLDRLIYCLWIADYGMRNAGDLAAACDLYASFQDEASQLSKELVLTVTQSSFALPRAKLEHQYFQLFDAICDEIRGAQLADSSRGLMSRIGQGLPLRLREHHDRCS